MAKDALQPWEQFPNEYLRLIQTDLEDRASVLSNYPDGEKVWEDLRMLWRWSEYQEPIWFWTIGQSPAEKKRLLERFYEDCLQRADWRDDLSDEAVKERALRWQEQLRCRWEPITSLYGSVYVYDIQHLQEEILRITDELTDPSDRVDDTTLRELEPWLAKGWFTVGFNPQVVSDRAAVRRGVPYAPGLLKRAEAFGRILPGFSNLSFSLCMAVRQFIDYLEEGPKVKGGALFQVCEPCRVLKHRRTFFTPKQRNARKCLRCTHHDVIRLNQLENKPEYQAAQNKSRRQNTANRRAASR